MCPVKKYHKGHRNTGCWLCRLKRKHPKAVKIFTKSIPMSVFVLVLAGWAIKLHEGHFTTPLIVARLLDFGVDMIGEHWVLEE
jgi:hypothetical protein